MAWRPIKLCKFKAMHGHGLAEEYFLTFVIVSGAVPHSFAASPLAPMREGAYSSF
jgi:hypothetical protein